MRKPETYTLAKAGFIAAVVATVTPLLWAGVNIILLPLSMYIAWCDLHLWNWFIAPYFHLAPISLWVALFLGIYLSGRYSAAPRILDQKYNNWEPLVAPLITHTTALFIAFFVHHYIA